MGLFQKQLHGLKLKHDKNTAELAAVRMPVPDKVYIPTLQHMGNPCKPVVKVGDLVQVGQLIADSEERFCAPIHASVSGKVIGLEEMINPNGIRVQAIVIEADHEQTVSPEVKPPVVNSPADFIKAVRDSGLVGLGGAGFPTHMKLSLKDPASVDTLIVNIAECEPFITADYRNCMENGQDIINGALLVKRYTSIKKIILALEDNKPRAIEHLRSLAQGNPEIEVKVLKSRYPQGAEKVLIFNTTGREIGDGQIPADVGVIVLNGTTTAFISKYMRTGMPLIEKLITVDGSAVKEPKNVIACIGTPFVEIIGFCGGYSQPPKKLLMGGPMMGIAVYDDDYPLLKNNNAVLAFGEKEAAETFETACIRCGRCTHACPFRLMPAEIERAYKLGDIKQLKKLQAQRCMECGCCAYVCPAKRYLVLTNRMAKRMLRESEGKKK